MRKLQLGGTGEGGAVMPIKRRRNMQFQLLRASNGGRITRNGSGKPGSAIREAQFAGSPNIKFENSQPSAKAPGSLRRHEGEPEQHGLAEAIATLADR